MSTNCISCIENERTGPDLLCSDCRDGNYEPEDQHKHMAGEMIKIANDNEMESGDKEWLISHMLFRLERRTKKNKE